MASLNPEPSQPEERAEQDLPEKSYAEALARKPEEQQQRLENQDARSYQKKKVTASNNTSADAAGGTANGVSTRNDESNIISYSKHRDSNGTALASVKTDEAYEEELKHNDETAPRSSTKKSIVKNLKQTTTTTTPKTELASGRKAGAGWQRSAIRWAPANVPLQRRLQTLAVLWHTTSIATFLTLFFLVAAVPLAWPILLPYLIYTLVFSNEATNGTLYRRSAWLRGSKFWSLFASYFPARLHRTVELEPTRKYIFGYHPHGIISHGAFASFATEALGFKDLFPGITNTLLTLDSNFRIPFYRDYALAMGLASVSRESIQNLLSVGGHDGSGMGRAVTIVVGGARESLDAQPHTLRLVLKSRKGFVKLAIRMGADLVPVLAFGENDLYDQVDSERHPWIHKGQMLVKKVAGFTIPLFHARGIFNYDVGLMPYRRAVNVVVGRPIKVVTQGRNDGAVNSDYLDEIHGQYVQELLRLWNSHKETFAGARDGELEIVE